MLVAQSVVYKRHLMVWAARNRLGAGTGRRWGAHSAWPHLPRLVGYLPEAVYLPGLLAREQWVETAQMLIGPPMLQTPRLGLIPVLSGLLPLAHFRAGISPSSMPMTATPVGTSMSHHRAGLAERQGASTILARPPRRLPQHDEPSKPPPTRSPTASPTSPPSTTPTVQPLPTSSTAYSSTPASAPPAAPPAEAKGVSPHCWSFSTRSAMAATICSMPGPLIRMRSGTRR